MCKNIKLKEVIMPRKKAEKDLNNVQVIFRCTKKDKLWIERNAKKRDINQKEFIMQSIKYYAGEEKRETRKQSNQAACACEVQALVNHLKRNHKEDSYVEEVCKKLWDLLN